MDYKEWYSETPLEFKKQIIRNFIQNTLQYADAHVKLRLSEITQQNELTLEDKCQRLMKWIGYIEFQKHTLKELDTDKLDYLLNSGLD